MDVGRIARSRYVWPYVVAASLGGMAGCAEWMSDFSPKDMMDNMTPSKETWEKMSPSNLWHSMQPDQLQKLNRGPGMSSDVYYSVDDPIRTDDPFQTEQIQRLPETRASATANGGADRSPPQRRADSARE